MLPLDCFASLAMTANGQDLWRLVLDRYPILDELMRRDGLNVALG